MQLLTSLRTFPVVVHAGETDTWHQGASGDPGHPNDFGHFQMFQCINVAALVGEDGDLPEC